MDNRERIIEEAAYMFRTYGIRSVTMDMLANQMGISKRTIYEVFRDKEELLQGVLKWMTLKQMELTSRSLETSGNVIEAIFKIMDNMMDHYSRMSPAFRLDMKKYHNDIVRKLNENEELPYTNSKEILLRGIKEGIFRKDLELEITNKCLTGVTRMSNERDVFASEETPDEKMLRNLFINYLRGISTQKGLDLINYYERQRSGDRSENVTGQDQL